MAHKDTAKIPKCNYIVIFLRQWNSTWFVYDMMKAVMTGVSSIL